MCVYVYVRVCDKRHKQDQQPCIELRALCAGVSPAIAFVGYSTGAIPISDAVLEAVGLTPEANFLRQPMRAQNLFLP